MHIAFAASEGVPFAKTGGLADVVGALPPEIVKLGHSVTAYMPLYTRVRNRIGEQPYAIRSITVPFRHYNRYAGVVNGGLHHGVQYYFIECPDLFDRAELYGPSGGDYPDNAERFGFFSRAVLEATKQLGIPDVFHVHDWQTGMIPVYLRTTFADDPALGKVPTVMTIHNAAYQGTYPPSTTEQLLLPWNVFTLDKVEQFDRFNFLKGGLVFADLLTTVSQKYAEEIQTAEFGWGLEGVLRDRSKDLYGILNGVDYSKWNPAKDGNLAAHYTSENLEGKKECRKDLLHAFGLDGVSETTAVIGIVSRFATQKGFDMVAQISEQLMDRDVVVVAIGTGEPVFESFFRGWAFRYPNQVSVRIAYDEIMSHKIEAGSDIFLMPSRYEPCGLNQIYSLKYGTVPVVRATGGLDDTIKEWDAKTGSGTGFKFQGYDARDLLAEVDRALAAFQDKQAWVRLMRNGMRQDFGWDNSAREYMKVYEMCAARAGSEKK
jgi:starch synthase